MYDALRLGFSEKDGWNTGIFRLYDILAQDFVYPKPSNIVVFADNHDVNRYLDSQNNDIRKLKMAMAFILTTRGTPEIYYGTEILMTTGSDKGDGSKRKDFPGGWLGDKINGFYGNGLSPEQQDMQAFLRNLLNWRKTKEVIHTGKLTHFIPQDGVYVYFRYNEHEAVMVAINNNETDAKTLNSSRYSEFLRNFKSGMEVISNQVLNDFSNITIQPKSSVIIELIR
jgi:glycosidase